MDDVELWHQHEGVLPDRNGLYLDHHHPDGDCWHDHDGFEQAQLVVTNSDGYRTVYGPDGQVAWHGSVEAPG
jgi:hypothetical protein